MHMLKIVEVGHYPFTLSIVSPTGPMSFIDVSAYSKPGKNFVKLSFEMIFGFDITLVHNYTTCLILSSKIDPGAMDVCFGMAKEMFLHQNGSPQESPPLTILSFSNSLIVLIDVLLWQLKHFTPFCLMLTLFHSYSRSCFLKREVLI